MNRPSNIDMTRRLIDHARARLPDLVMRTTFIVGYPGETDEQFQTLLDFVEEQEFDHVGVFTYSPEPGTKAVDARPARRAGRGRRGTPQRHHGGAAADLAAQEPGAGGADAAGADRGDRRSRGRSGRQRADLGRPRPPSRAGGRWPGLRARSAPGRLAHRPRDRRGGAVRPVGASSGARRRHVARGGRTASTRCKISLSSGEPTGKTRTGGAVSELRGNGPCVLRLWRNDRLVRLRLQRRSAKAADSQSGIRPLAPRAPHHTYRPLERRH